MPLIVSHISLGTSAGRVLLPCAGRCVGRVRQRDQGSEPRAQRGRGRRAAPPPRPVEGETRTKPGSSLVLKWNKSSVLANANSLFSRVLRFTFGRFRLARTNLAGVGGQC